MATSITKISFIDRLKYFTKLEDLIDRSSRLEREVGDVRKQLSFERKKLAVQGEKINELEKAVKEKEALIYAHDMAKESLEKYQENKAIYDAKLVEIIKINSDEEHKLQKLKSSIKESIEKKAVLKQEISNLEAVGDEKARKIDEDGIRRKEAIKLEINSLKKAEAEIADSIDEHNQRLQELGVKEQDAKINIERLGDEIKALRESIDTLSQGKMSLQAELEKHKTECDTMQNQLKDMTGALDDEVVFRLLKLDLHEGFVTAWAPQIFERLKRRDKKRAMDLFREIASRAPSGFMPDEINQAVIDDASGESDSSQKMLAWLLSAKLSGQNRPVELFEQFSKVWEKYVAD